MKVLYTDFDPFLCAWLEELVRSRALPAGDVLCKDVREIGPEDVEGLTTAEVMKLSDWARKHGVSYKTA